MSFPCDQFSVPFYELTGDLELDRRNLRANWMEIERAIRNCFGAAAPGSAPGITTASITLVNDGEANTGVGMTTPLPNPVLPGQIMLAFIMARTRRGDQADPQIGAPSGWDEIRHDQTAPTGGTANANHVAMGIYSRVAGPSEPASVHWTANGTEAGRMQGVIIQLSPNATLAGSQSEFCAVGNATGALTSDPCTGAGVSPGPLNITDPPVLLLSFWAQSSGAGVADPPPEMSEVIKGPGATLAQESWPDVGNTGEREWPSASVQPSGHIRSANLISIRSL